MTSRQAIEEYWEQPNTVSLVDKNLRKLEEQVVLKYLHGGMSFADFGCGDGSSTAVYATKVKSCLALEQSNRLRGLAQARVAEAGLTNVTVEGGSVTDLERFRGQFHAVATQRVVINFMSWEEQKQVIENIRSTLRPGGIYVMIENTFDGFEAMNSVRREVGLNNVPLHDWHNYFMFHDDLMAFLSERFRVEAVHNFNLYYLLTRVFENMFANFTGFGANVVKDDIFDAADAAARRLHEVMNDRIQFKLDKGSSFGPIQGLVLRRFD